MPTRLGTSSRHKRKKLRAEDITKEIDQAFWRLRNGDGLYCGVCNARFNDNEKRMLEFHMDSVHLKKGDKKTL